MKLALASDHAGWALRRRLGPACEALGHSVLDYGPGDASSVDYPDFAKKVALAVTSGEVDRGILVCGSGVGMAMAANRFLGVRAVAASTVTEARLSRAHNDANVLCLGSRLLGDVAADEILAAFLATPFEGGRHQRRVQKLSDLGH